MSKFNRIALAGIALAGAVSTPALAVGRLADVTITDRDTGQTLQAHYHRGEYWVAGRPGAHYSIQIQSREGRRLLAVTSVDGVNVLTGETAAFGQRGYVFDPWNGYGIAGWRKSDSQIAAFTFTSIPRSYAARTGRPDNVGVIGVALFRERAPQFVPLEIQPEYRDSQRQAPTLDMPAPAPPPAAGAAADSLARAQNSASGALREESAPRKSESLGTGHGRREYSRVYTVAFERENERPDEIIRIRYDSQENLVAMGVIRRPPPRPRAPEAFPDAPRLGYVPDP